MLQMAFQLEARAKTRRSAINFRNILDSKHLLEVIVDANAAAVINLLIVIRMPRLMPSQSDFVDETRLLRTDQAFVDLLAVVMVNHVFLEMRFVAKDFSTERASNFVDDVRVAEMIFQDAFRRIVLVANVAGKQLGDDRVLQFDMTAAITLIQKRSLNYQLKYAFVLLPNSCVNFSAELAYDIGFPFHSFFSSGRQHIWFSFLFRFMEHLVHRVAME